MDDNILDQKWSAGSLLRFAFPTIVMMIFMGLYTIVDTIFVAQFVNTDALSSINIVCPIINANQGLNFPKSNGKHCERNAAKDMQEQALRRAHFGSGLNICQVTKPIEERFDGLPHRTYKCRHGIPSEQCVAALLLSGCPNLHAILLF